MTSVRVKLPPVLRQVVGGTKDLEASGASIAEVIDDLAARFPALGLHLFDEQGAIRRNIVFLHDGELIRPPEARQRLLAPGDEVTITNALAGG